MTTSTGDSLCDDFCNKQKLAVFILRKLKAWQDEHELVEKDVMHYLTNPLNAFAIIKRATSDIKLIEQRFPEESKKFLENIKALRPDDDDLNGAVDGLLRLQTIYKLESDDFANGIIDGSKTRKAFSAHDLFVIGEEALSIENQEYFALNYFEIVWDRLNNEIDPDKEVNENALLYYLTSCYNKSGNFQDALSYAKILVERNPDLKEYDDFKNQLVAAHAEFGDSMLELLDPYSDYYEKDGYFFEHKETILYSQACRGNLNKSAAEQAKLSCRYESRNPFTKLARIKVEELNLEPTILLYVDVLSNAETDFLTSRAKSNIERAQVAPDGKAGKTTNARVAQNSWHFDSEHETYHKITQRIQVVFKTFKKLILVIKSRSFQDMTGLQQATAEPIQVQNYGIGGHYDLHWDHRIKRDIPMVGHGNRIATVLLYVSF